MIDIRDDVDLAKNLVACAYLACQAPTLPATERRALCAVLNAARETLEVVGGALERVTQSGGSKQGPEPTATPPNRRRQAP